MNNSNSFYDSEYFLVSELRDESKDRLPIEVLSRFDSGAESLFESFRECQPLTYEALVLRDNQISLLEIVEDGLPLHWIGIRNGKNLIVGNLHNIDSLEYIEKEDLEKLPNEFTCYYDVTDGFNTVTEPFPGLHTFGLPKRLSTWVQLGDFLAGQKLESTMLSKLTSVPLSYRTNSTG